MVKSNMLHIGIIGLGEFAGLPKNAAPARC
jgi:hypothetical protein